YPDFPTGGLIDTAKYNDGLRGGKIRIRARIAQLDKKTLVIKEIPFGCTTTSLIDSVINANDKGKIKIRKIEDNTAEFVEILIHLAPGISPDQTIDALYAFTDCEVSVSPNSCVISNDKPQFLGIAEILKISTQRTVDLLKKELEITKRELEEQLFYCLLEKIFIENKIYRFIENCETWESVVQTIHKKLVPFRKQLKRDVTDEDVVRLTEIKIKRISKFDSLKANEEIKKIKVNTDEVKNHLAHIIDYAINYFRQIKKKYGKGRERKTEIRVFDTIEAASVVVANQKLYINKTEGFVGTSLTKDEFVCECSDIDEIIAFRSDGTFVVTKISEKIYVGTNVIHIAIFKRNDERTVYNMIYSDGFKGKIMVKRFSVVGITRDKEYNLTKGTNGSRVLYFTANPNGEAETITVHLKSRPKLRNTVFDFDFSGLLIKGRNSMGNILTKFAIHKITLKEAGTSTLSSLDIWFDEAIKRLNTDKYGKFLGSFNEGEKILTIMQSGHYKLTSFDLTTHFDDDLIYIEKFEPQKIYTAVYYDGENKYFFMKRFLIEPTDKKVIFISEAENSYLVGISTDECPRVEITYRKEKGKQKPNEKVSAVEFIDVKGYKAKGKRLSNYTINQVEFIASLKPKVKPIEEIKTEEVKPAPVEKKEIKKTVKEKVIKEPEIPIKIKKTAKEKIVKKPIKLPPKIKAKPKNKKGDKKKDKQMKLF
ncbi:MAG: DNA gyrase/topoisomerase IV subunit A, partial [Bacteroidales bacterium]|nr:DNA gyrase/topoisomerase IV subunit A [Bacteroidales bacterium]